MASLVHRACKGERHGIRAHDESAFRFRNGNPEPARQHPAGQALDHDDTDDDDENHRHQRLRARKVRGFQSQVEQGGRRRRDDTPGNSQPRYRRSRRRNERLEQVAEHVVGIQQAQNGARQDADEQQQEYRRQPDPPREPLASETGRQDAA